MKICHVCSAHSADDGRVFHRACVSLAAEGYDVHLIANSPETRPYREKGVTIHPVRPWRSRAERFRHRALPAKLAADLQPDLFHVHEPELLAPVLARAGSRPVIWDVHESYLSVLMDREWIPRSMRPLARFAWDLQERALVRRCAAVVAATARVAERYTDLHPDVVTVANYPNVDEIDGLPPASRDSSTCVYAGTILPNRGIDKIIGALALLRQRGLDIRLALAGKGDDDYLRDLLGEARRLGVGDLVTYHGVLSKRDALLLQQKSGIGIISGLPIGNNLAAVPVKMVECMALGLPLVYSDFPSHREVAGLYDAGIAIDPTSSIEIADAIERLIRDPELARKLGENGVRGVRESFNWDVERAKLLRLYEKLLGPTAGVGAALPSGERPRSNAAQGSA